MKDIKIFARKKNKRIEDMRKQYKSVPIDEEQRLVNLRKMEKVYCHINIFLNIPFILLYMSMLLKIVNTFFTLL